MALPSAYTELLRNTKESGDIRIDDGIECSTSSGPVNSIPARLTPPPAIQEYCVRPPTTCDLDGRGSPDAVALLEASVGLERVGASESATIPDLGARPQKPGSEFDPEEDESQGGYQHFWGMPPSHQPEPTRPATEGRSSCARARVHRSSHALRCLYARCTGPLRPWEDQVYWTALVR
ncbi:hypothetical protein DL770_009031 [Monosporascus sp. CRB-9-2]|nr:hypothetical protein DL770_009031 [Monosporascus sp. CRB-9-2]